MANFFRKIRPFIIFLLISLTVLSPWHFGYYFTLDTVPIAGYYPFRIFVDPITLLMKNAASFVLGEVLAQRLLLMSLLMLLGLGGYYLAHRVTSTKGFIAYFVGLFAIFNPFVYDRFLDGQYFVIFGTACFLWTTICLLKYLQHPEAKTAIAVGILSGLTIAFSPHALFFIITLLLAFFPAYFPDHRALQLIKGLTIIISILILLNINWITGQLFLNGEKGVFIPVAINKDHFLSFASNPGANNIYFNILSLRGYWGEGESRFLPASFFIKHEGGLFLLIFLIVIIGIFYGIQNQKTRKNTLIISIIAIVAYVLSMGIASPHLGFITQRMYDYIPFYKGLREPQKWSGILLTCYLYFSAIGLKNCLEWRFIRTARVFWGIFFIFLPILYTSSMLFGFMGQLKTIDYPADWYRLREEFLTEGKRSNDSCISKKENVTQKCYDVLALPWHQYMGYSFVGKVISNPLEGFFHSVRVIQGDNIEIGNIYTQSIRPASKIIEKYIGPGVDRQGIERQNFLNDLTNLGIRYILVAKEVDWEAYNNHLKKNRRLEEIWDSESFLIYKIVL